MLSSVADPWQFGTDPGVPKTYGYGSGTPVHLHRSSRIKSHKEVTKQKKTRFFSLYLLDDSSIRSRMWIQDAQKHTNPDPQHWYCPFFNSVAFRSNSYNRVARAVLTPCGLVELETDEFSVFWRPGTVLEEDSFGHPGSKFTCIWYRYI